MEEKYTNFVNYVDEDSIDEKKGAFEDEEIVDNDEDDEENPHRHLHLQNSSRSLWARAPEMLEGFCSLILQYTFIRTYSRFKSQKFWKVL